MVGCYLCGVVRGRERSVKVMYEDDEAVVVFSEVMRCPVVVFKRHEGRPGCDSEVRLVLLAHRLFPGCRVEYPLDCSLPHFYFYVRRGG